MKYVPHMVTFFDSIEWAILMAGWRQGVEALVTSWIEYQRSRLHWEETWEPDGRHRYFNEYSPGVRFVIEWVARDQWALGVSWPDDWGHQHIGTGTLEDLQEEANKLARVEGPFGGPTSPPRNICAFPRDRVWRVAGEVERRFEVLSETIYAHFHITRKGTINNLRLFSPGPTTLQMHVDSLKDIEPSDLRQGVLVDGKRRPWTYTAMRPLLAHMRLGERELLLVCPNPPTAVILVHTEGRLQVAAMLDSSYLSEFDMAWLDDAPPWPDPQGAFGHIHVRKGPPPWAASPPSSPSSPRNVEGVPRPSSPTNSVSRRDSPAQSPPRPASTPPTTAAGAAPSPRPTTLPASPRTAEVNPRTSPAGGVSSPPRSSAPTPFSTIGTTSTASRPTASPDGSPPRPVPPPTAEAAPTASPLTPSPRPVAPPPGPTIQPPPPTAEATPASSQPTHPPVVVQPETASVVEPPPPSASSPPPIAEATPAPTGAPETPTTTGTPGCIADPSGAPLPSPLSPATAELPTSTGAEPRATESSQPSSPVGVPPPPTSEAPEAAPPEREQPEPRFPLPGNPSPAEMERHFADVEPAIPPKETGAAVAVEIWQAIGEAHRHGALPITGGWIDLVSTLHRRGWLPRLPGDRATRAALAILEGLSPLIRRLHRRRWALGLER